MYSTLWWYYFSRLPLDVVKNYTHLQNMVVVCCEENVENVLSYSTNIKYIQTKWRIVLYSLKIL